MIGLATRGYLCPPARVLPALPPPSASVIVEAPKVVATEPRVAPIPVISSASAKTPNIASAVGVQDPTPDKAPSVTEASILVPSIRKVEKD